MEQRVERAELRNDSPAVPSSSAAAHGLFVVLFIIALALAGWGAYLAYDKEQWTTLSIGVATVLGVAALWAVVGHLGSARRAGMRGHDALLRTLNDRLQQISVLLNVVTEQQMLSDQAKSVAFRDKDRDALRRAIQEDLVRKDYEAAMALVNDMERAFGYQQEAERFRKEINSLRMDAVRRQIGEAAATIDGYCRQEKWSEALRDAEKLMTTFPGNDQVQQLPQEIEGRRQAHKKQLVDSWKDALARKDIDGSIEIIKKLDVYLTRAEGEEMSEAARDVFKEKLNNLRVQFTMAVRGENWHEAVRVGETIMRDFPNSGISREVHDQMDNLRRRANEQPEMART